MLLTPLQLIFFIAIDLFFLIINIILTPLFFLISLCVTDSKFIKRTEDYLNSVFTALFGLQKTDIEGFRRLRTSCQFSFESVPQVLCQIWIILRLDQINAEA